MGHREEGCGAYWTPGPQRWQWEYIGEGSMLVAAHDQTREETIGVEMCRR